MSTVPSAEIMAQMRLDAQKLGRPEVRLATLERLVVACNAIADGSAKAIIRKGNAQALRDFAAISVPIIPPRVEAYVHARRAIDLKEGVPKSLWTGPVASSIRKERDGMLAYVRQRDLERRPSRSVPRNASKNEWWQLVDDVHDEVVKLRLMRLLSDGQKSAREVVALKGAVRLCSPNFNIDGYLSGQQSTYASSEIPRLAGTSGVSDQNALLTSLVDRLTTPASLAAFDLEFDGQRVRQIATKEPLVTMEELAVLRAFLDPG